MTADTQHSVSSGKQILPPIGCAELESGDRIGVSTAPVVQNLLQSCVDDPHATLDTFPADDPVGIHAIHDKALADIPDTSSTRA